MFAVVPLSGIFRAFVSRVLTRGGCSIETILRRIPDGWGRRISVDAGWCPLVVASDHHLAKINPDYVVQQIKEKFGTRATTVPPSHDSAPEVSDAFDAVTDDAERASGITCERRGDPEVLQRTHYWAITLCHSCAGPLGYAPVSPTGHGVARRRRAAHRLMPTERSERTHG